MAVRYRDARAGVILLVVRHGSVFLVERAEICGHDIERRSCVAYQGYLGRRRRITLRNLCLPSVRSASFAFIALIGRSTNDLSVLMENLRSAEVHSV